MNYDHISSFDYFLPKCLIASYPLKRRDDSRLLLVNALKKSFSHSHFADIVQSLNAKDVLVINNTKVFPARLYGHKKNSGGQVECLIERVIASNRALVHLKSSKSFKPNAELLFSNTLVAVILKRIGDLFLIEFKNTEPLFDMFEKLGQVPLPPYLNRHPKIEDSERYQTVYAKQLGAVAAPTAGLHFTKELLSSIKSSGVTIAEITLHVGSGTFQPLRVEQVHQHRMHSEYVEVSEAACSAIIASQQSGGRVIAVGTTTLRALETATNNRLIAPFQGETRLFIKPGYDFQCVDSLITNFHLPKSTLLMLVTAFGGYDLIMRAYQEAIDQRYRFYSYGDAMMIMT